MAYQAGDYPPPARVAKLFANKDKNGRAYYKSGESNGTRWALFPFADGTYGLYLLDCRVELEKNPEEVSRDG